jgi:hypothetical protein
MSLHEWGTPRCFERLIAVVGGDRVGGVEPGGVDDVAQFNGAVGDALDGEGLALGRACTGEGAGLVELIELEWRR